MNALGIRISPAAKEILDRAQQAVREGELPSMAWGVMVLLQVNFPDLVQNEAPVLNELGWKEALTGVMENPDWGTARDLHTVISGAAAACENRTADGAIEPVDLLHSVEAIIRGPLSNSTHQDEDPGLEQTPPRWEGEIPKGLRNVVSDPLDSGRPFAIAEVPEHLELVAELERVLLRSSSNKVVLVGERGVGKSSLVHALAERLGNENCPVAQNGVAVASATQLIGKVGGVSPAAGGRIRSIVDGLARAGRLFCVEDIAVPVAKNHSMEATTLEVLAGAIGDSPEPVLFTAEPEDWNRESAKASGVAKHFEVVRVPELGPESVRKVLLSMRRAVTPEGKRTGDFLPLGVIEAAVASAGDFESAPAPAGAIGLLDRLVARAIQEERNVTLAMLDEEFGIKGASFLDGQAERKLKERVIGQEEPIEAAVTAIAIHESGLKSGNSRPVSLFLAGPTGVGKTEFGRAIAELRSGSEDKFVFLDMAEFANEGALTRLLGSSPSFVGYGDGVSHWAALEADPHCVVMIDEIEKAHPAVIQALLGAMDAGRLTLGTGHRLDLSKAVMIFTSNVEIGGTRQMGFGPEQADCDVSSALAKHFPPEWVNRLDAICLFRPLGPEAVKDIVRTRLVPATAERLRQRGMDLEVAPEVIAHIALLGHSERFGARELARTYEHELIVPMSRSVPRRGKGKVTATLDPFTNQVKVKYG